MLPNAQPLKQQASNNKVQLLIAGGCIAWMAIIAKLSMSLAGGLTIAALIIVTLLLVIVGRYYPRSPQYIYSFSKLWLKHWKYTVTILALTMAGLPIGRFASDIEKDTEREQKVFDSMTPTQHLITAREKQLRDRAEARRHLYAIPATAKEEYRAAQELLPLVDPEEQRRRERLQREKEEAVEREKKAAQQRAELAQKEAEQEKFNAMSPTQHLAAAAKSMGTGYDSKERIGGHLDEAQKHLNAIPSEAGEHKQGDRLQREIDARKDRLAKAWLREHRKQAANELDQLFIKTGINVDNVQAIGKENTILRVNYALCSRVLFDRMTPPKAIAAWQSAGFTRVECRADDETHYLDLK